jgi:hypothetical protein
VFHKERKVPLDSKKGGARAFLVLFPTWQRMHIAPITSVAQPRKIGTVLTTLPYKRCVMLLAIAGGHSSISSCTLTSKFDHTSLKCSAKNGIFEPFIHKNDHFAKTGSGQT